MMIISENYLTLLLINMLLIGTKKQSGLGKVRGSIE